MELKGTTKRALSVIYFRNPSLILIATASQDLQMFPSPSCHLPAAAAVVN
jgi:hypothetical protein